MARPKKKNTAQAAGETLYAVAQRISGALSGGRTQAAAPPESPRLPREDYLMAADELELDEGGEILPAINTQRELYPTGEGGVDPSSPEITAPETPIPSPTCATDRSNSASASASRTLMLVLGGVTIVLFLFSITLLYSFHKTSETTQAELEQLQDKVYMLQDKWDYAILEQVQVSQLHVEGVEKEVAQLSDAMRTLNARLHRVDELWEAVSNLQADTAKLQLAESSRAASGVLQKYATLLPLPSKPSPALSASLAMAACDLPHLQGLHGELLPATVIGHSYVAGQDSILMKTYFFVARFLKPPSTSMVNPQARYLVSTASDPFKTCFAMQMDSPDSTPFETPSKDSPSDVAALNSSENTFFVDVDINLQTPGVAVGQPDSSNESGGEKAGGYRLTGITLVHSQAALLSSDKALRRFQILLDPQTPGEGDEPTSAAWEQLGEFEMDAPRNSSQGSCPPGDAKESAWADGTCVSGETLPHADDTMGRCQTFKLRMPGTRSSPNHPTKCRLRIVVLSNHGGDRITCMPKLLFHGERIA